MNTTFFNGVTGMVAYQQDMDVISHNISNVNTYGFKPSRSAFADVLYTKMAINGPEQLVGHGVRTVSTDLDMLQGNLEMTSYPFDFAIEGSGFFAADDLKGGVSYTRNGAFRISVEGNKEFLVTAYGGHVLDGAGKPIELVKKKDSEEYDMNAITEKLGVYQFDNPYGLSQTDSSMFKQSDNSGTATVLKPAGKNKALPYKVVSGALERSKTDIAREMANVIMTQKAFQMNARIVQTGDQMDEVISGLR